MREQGLAKCRTQVKNEISAVLQRCLKGRPPMSDLFSRQGRAWLAVQDLPADERLSVEGGLLHLDFLGEELAQIDRLVAAEALTDPDVRRLELRAGAPRAKSGPRLDPVWKRDADAFEPHLAE